MIQSRVVTTGHRRYSHSRETRCTTPVARRPPAGGTTPPYRRGEHRRHSADLFGRRPPVRGHPTVGRAEGGACVHARLGARGLRRDVRAPNRRRAEPGEASRIREGLRSGERHRHHRPHGRRPPARRRARNRAGADDRDHPHLRHRAGAARVPHRRRQARLEQQPRVSGRAARSQARPHHGGAAAGEDRGA